jgi:hypothetical protein
MSASMTLAEIQAKYSAIHSPDEVAQYQQNMTNGKKWKVAKGEWTWDGLTHMQLRGRALQYHPNLDMMELYSEHPYKTALRLVPKEEYLEDSGDEESEAGSDLELDDEAHDEHDDKVKEAVKQYGLLKKRMEPEGSAKKPAKKVAAVAVDGEPVAKKKAGRPSTKGTTWEQFINMNRIKGAHMTPIKYVTYCQNTVDDDGNQRDATMPVMFKKISDLSPYWMAIEHSSVNDSISWQILPTQDPPFTPDEGEGDLWY